MVCQGVFSCVRAHYCCPLAPFTRTCIVVIQNYILPVLNKLDVTIFSRLTDVPLAVICSHAKSQYYYAEALRRPNCTFWGIQADLHSRLLRYGKVQPGLRNWRSAASRVMLMCELAVMTQCWLIVFCFCGI
jgi:hypothetical protein